MNIYNIKKGSCNHNVQQPICTGRPNARVRQGDETNRTQKPPAVKSIGDRKNSSDAIRNYQPKESSRPIIETEVVEPQY